MGEAIFGEVFCLVGVIDILYLRGVWWDVIDS